jgi:hypothetical protein
MEFCISMETTRRLLSIYEGISYIHNFLSNYIIHSTSGTKTTSSGLPKYSRVDINDIQPSKPTVQKYPPLALMETLRHGNPYAHASPVTISPPDCMPLSLHSFLYIPPPFDINDKGYSSSEAAPLIYKPLLNST